MISKYNLTRKKRKIKNSSVSKYSLRSKLKKEGRSSEELENILRTISLEELIALKLELSFHNVGGFVFNLPLWVKAENIMKDSLLKFAISSTDTMTDAAALLGLSRVKLYKAIKNYDTVSSLEENHQEESSDPEDI